MSGPFAFEASTPADAQTNPCRVSAITSGGRARTISLTLAEDDLETPRVLLSRELARAGGRLDVVEVDDATLDLRDGLLRDHDDVVRLQAARPSRRFGEERGEIVSLLQLRDPVERDDADFTPHGSPVTRMPAWPR